MAEVGLDLASRAPDALAKLFPRDCKKIVLEIGFGGGEHFVARATAEPWAGYIGVEPYLNGIAKVVRAIDIDGLENIRLFSGDARDLLEWLPAGSIDRIDLLYPDPWPKKRHWKRRFFGPNNLDRMARVLKPGSDLCFATDIGTYVEWALYRARRHPDFEWTAQSPSEWRTPWDGWPGTRYEAKAIREGRTPTYLTFRRR
ncbi:MAG: tRNA (guanosine(46)-N7)-methyltransferase TrmB [Pseudomonadota bacterium]